MEVAGRLFDLADRLESKTLYRFAEQLRGSGLSMSNNIAAALGAVQGENSQIFLI
jgi:four helix bundle protein